jgi:4a-hydroxytetrahydrobiopterin dehydratase
MDVRNWIITDKGLFRSLSFQSFTALTQFLAELAPVADKLDHHPDLRIRKAVVLDIWLITHDSGTITEKDTELAAVINRLSESYGFSS